MLLHLSLLTRGLAGDLPFVPEADEVIFVPLAAQMAASGSWDPGWYGNPGGTLIYPLALLYRFGSRWLGQGLPVPEASSLSEYEPHHAALYLQARWLSILMLLLSLVPIYAIAERIGRRSAPLLAILLAPIYPVLVFHVQIVRSDGAGILFGMLALWMILRADERPSHARIAAAGLALGLAIATRYFLVVLLVVALAFLFFPRRGDGEPNLHLAALLRRFALRSTTLLAASLAGFAIAAPFALIRWRTTFGNLAVEGRSEHLGADGLSQLGNLRWYLIDALPRSVGGPQVLLLLLGLASLWIAARSDGGRERRRAGAVGLAFLVCSLLSFSLSSLHWQRWLIQILPVVAIFVATGIEALASASARLVECKVPVGGRAAPSVYRLTIVALTILAVWAPLRGSISHVEQRAGNSSRVEARWWLEQELPEDARVALSPFSAASAGARYESREIENGAALADLDALAEDGFDVLVLGSWSWSHFMAQPDRYPQEEAAFRQLLDAEQPLHVIPSRGPSAGPEIRIYATGPDDSTTGTKRSVP